MKIKIVNTLFDPWQEAQKFQNSMIKTRVKFSATNVFIGTMRDFNDDDKVKSMTLEYYPGMTEKQLNFIVTEVMQKWSLLDVLLIHRVGYIIPYEPIVLIGVWGVHRADTFASSRYIMETLKTKAPFWKKELLSTNVSKWVQSNT